MTRAAAGGVLALPAEVQTGITHIQAKVDEIQEKVDEIPTVNAMNDLLKTKFDAFEQSLWKVLSGVDPEKEAEEKRQAVLLAETQEELKNLKNIASQIEELKQTQKETMQRHKKEVEEIEAQLEEAKKQRTILEKANKHLKNQYERSEAFSNSLHEKQLELEAELRVYKVLLFSFFSFSLIFLCCFVRRFF